MCFSTAGTNAKTSGAVPRSASLKSFEDADVARDTRFDARQPSHGRRDNVVAERRQRRVGRLVGARSGERQLDPRHRARVVDVDRHRPRLPTVSDFSRTPARRAGRPVLPRSGEAAEYLVGESRGEVPVERLAAQEEAVEDSAVERVDRDAEVDIRA